MLKVFLDLLPQFALQGKLVLPMATGGSPNHMLALDYALRPVLLGLLEELTRADNLAQSDRKQAIKLIADFSELDACVVSLFLQRRSASPVGVQGYGYHGVGVRRPRIRLATQRLRSRFRIVCSQKQIDPAHQ